MKKLLLTTLLLSPLAQADNAYYPMICRGGTSVVVNNQTSTVFGDCSGAIVCGSASSDVTFTKSNVAANPNTHGANLAPGTCAWLDRAMRTTEPSLIRYVSSYEMAGIVSYTFTSTTRVTGPMGTPATWLSSTFNLLTDPNRTLELSVRAVSDHFELKPKQAIKINMLP